MSKKKLRSKYTSKGIIGLNRQVLKALKRDRHPVDVDLNKWAAFIKGKKVFFTIENPNKKQTDKKFIKVLASDLYGDWRNYV